MGAWGMGGCRESDLGGVGAGGAGAVVIERECICLVSWLVRPKSPARINPTTAGILACETDFWVFNIYFQCDSDWFCSHRIYSKHCSHLHQPLYRHRHAVDEMTMHSHATSIRYFSR